MTALIALIALAVIAVIILAAIAAREAAWRFDRWRARRRPPEFLTEGQMALREVSQIGRVSGRAYQALFGEPWPHRALRRARGFVSALAA